MQKYACITFKCARYSLEYSFLLSLLDVWTLLLSKDVDLLVLPKLKPDPEVGAGAGATDVAPNLNPELVTLPPNDFVSSTLGLHPGLGVVQQAQASTSASFCIIHVLKNKHMDFLKIGDNK